MDKKIRVLIVHNYYQIPGGEDAVVANEKKMLEEYGHKVILYKRNNDELKEMSKFQKLLLPITTVFNIKTYQDIQKIIRNEHIHIVHVHNTLNLVSPAVYYAALSCNVPVIQTIHNYRLLCPGATFYRKGYICEDCVKHGLLCAIKHNCYRNSKLQTLACVINTKFHRITRIYGKINYICLTEFSRDKILSLKQIKPNKVFIKPNFVRSIGDFVSANQRENQYIFVGRLDKLKGIDILLKAWKQLRIDGAKLIVCGTGPMEDWCREFVAENDVNVELKGFLSNIVARKLMSNSRALILPTQWYEGFPMSIIEAYSVGTPVLCSDLGNAGSVVIDGITGYKFKADSVKGILSAVEMLSKCNSIYSTTYELYIEKYTQTVNYKLLREVYDKLL